MFWSLSLEHEIIAGRGPLGSGFSSECGKSLLIRAVITHCPDGIRLPGWFVSACRSLDAVYLEVVDLTQMNVGSILLSFTWVKVLNERVVKPKTQRSGVRWGHCVSGLTTGSFSTQIHLFICVAGLL